LDDLDRRLLSLVQEDFAIDEQPYLRLAERLGCTEEDVITRLAALVEQGVIRDVSPVFDLRLLGYSSTLAALDVPPDRVEEVAALINARPEVTHNYLREGHPNLWFTVIAESDDALRAILSSVERDAGCGTVHNLPATRMFKARVVFALEDAEPPGGAGGAEWGTYGAPIRPVVGAADWSIIEQLQEGIPLASRPYDALAERAAMPVPDFLDRTRALKGSGIIRRMGVRLRHHQAGMRGNILSVWRVPDDDAERVGLAFARLPEVTHCYTRPTFEGFPYNLYAMVSAATPEAAEAVVRRMADAVRITDYVTLKTGRELKKSTPRYRRPAHIA